MNSRTKNYKIWYRASVILLIVASLIHFTGYFTNMFYIVAWLLWMPAIALFLITFFDWKNSKKSIKHNLFSEKYLKTYWFVVFTISVIYVLFNLFYCMSIVSGVSDLNTTDGVYYLIDSAGKKKEISFDEYVRYALASFRVLSGHMLAFLTAPVWYYYSRNMMEEEQKEGGKQNGSNRSK